VLAKMVMFSPTSISPEVSGDEILKSEIFLYYCCCGGVALGPFGNPFIAAEAKELCLHSTVQCTDIINDTDGLCSQMNVMCCITEQCQLPPLKGSPKCICCTKELAPGDGVSKKDEIIEDYAAIMSNTKWLMYAFCGGCGLSGIGGDRPLYGMVVKELCIRESVEIDLKKVTETDGTMCAVAATELCFWSQCQFPPKEDQPLFACFKFKKARGGK